MSATLCADTWRACDNPHRLITTARRVGSSRRYLLLACAMVRDRPEGVGERAGDVLSAVEAEIPVYGKPPQKDLLRDVLVPAFPDLFRPDATAALALSQEGLRVLGRDAPWVRLFAQYAGSPRATRTSLPHVVAEWLSASDFQRAAQARAARELRELRGNRPGRPRNGVYDAMRALIGLPPAGEIVEGSSWQLEWQRSHALVVEYRRWLCDLIREQVGDPFRPWRPRPEWLAANDGTARRLAEEMSVTGDWSIMPVLGDALEDAGCGDEEALRHCRDDCRHRRGCWVAEAILAVAGHG